MKIKPYSAVLLTAIITYCLIYFLGLARLPFESKEVALSNLLSTYDNSKNSYWLTKRGPSSEEDNIAVFFGYLDDHEGCKIVASLLNKKYSSTELYKCNKAN